MKKEFLLLAASVVATLVLAIVVLRLFAPGLLGMPVDMQLVQVSEKLPPFFEGVFRLQDYTSSEFILKDPRTSVRAKPQYPELGSIGPHDILGFRNRTVPSSVDIVVIGDSQTYGNNVLLENNWPNQMMQAIDRQDINLYSMAVGGWGAVQYLDMFNNALAFRPRVVIVAFYSGNDALESFTVAYGIDHWAPLRPDPDLDVSDIPKGKFPAPESEWWPVQFGDGITTIFTPKLRYRANQDHPGVSAGYKIMATVGELIARQAHQHSIKVFFTIIPTKELVYLKKIRNSDIEITPEYHDLIEAEQKNIAQLRQALEAIESAQYIDVIQVLQSAALELTVIYPENTNGHPIESGYAIIGSEIAKAVSPELLRPVEGLVLVKLNEEVSLLALVKDNKLWVFANPNLARAHGLDPTTARVISERDVATLKRGFIDPQNPVWSEP